MGKITHYYLLKLATGLIYALKSLGVTICISISASRGLQKKFKQGSFIILDQTINRTKNRISTFFCNGVVAYPSMANPFCPNLQSTLLTILRDLIESTVHDSGTYLCMEGPALSTRTESKPYQSWELTALE